MIAQHPVAFGIVVYLGVGALIFLVCVWIAGHRDDPLIRRTASLIEDTIVAACVILLLPLFVVAAPFIALLAFCLDALNLPPIRLKGRKPGKGALPPGFCLCLCRNSMTPTGSGDTAELPAFLRQQIDPIQPTRRR